MYKLITAMLVIISALLFFNAAFSQDLFNTRIDYAVGDNPSSVFSTDLDGDGDNDLVTANAGSDNVSILLNNGDGTFQSTFNYAVGVAPHSVFSTDLDGDGDDDIATANNYSNNVSILLNNGDGTFQSAVTYVVGGGPYSVFSTDFNLVSIPLTFVLRVFKSDLIGLRSSLVVNIPLRRFISAWFKEGFCLGIHIFNNK